jgi:transcriptional regulator with XRE-family HTH domain
MDWNSLSNSEIVLEFGKRIKGYRIKKRLTQQELADKAGISLFTVTQVEKGKPVSCSTLIAILRVLRMLDNFEMLIPEMEVSPIEQMKLQGKISKRIRHKKNK